jgi:Mg2+ and Co2+ transporter CorA
MAAGLLLLRSAFLARCGSFWVYLNANEKTEMSERKTPFATVEEALEEIRQGSRTVLVDDEDRAKSRLIPRFLISSSADKNSR